MNLIMRTLILLLPFVITSCSYLSPQSVLQNRNREYLRATSVPPLRIPPGIAYSQIHNTFPVSYAQYPESAKDVSLVPPGL